MEVDSGNSKTESIEKSNSNDSNSMNSRPDSNWTNPNNLQSNGGNKNEENRSASVSSSSTTRLAASYAASGSSRRTISPTQQVPTPDSRPTATPRDQNKPNNHNRKLIGNINIYHSSEFSTVKQTEEKDVEGKILAEELSFLIEIQGDEPFKSSYSGIGYVKFKDPLVIGQRSARDEHTAIDISESTSRRTTQFSQTQQAPTPESDRGNTNEDTTVPQSTTKKLRKVDVFTILYFLVGAARIVFNNLKKYHLKVDGDSKPLIIGSVDIDSILFFLDILSFVLAVILAIDYRSKTT